MVPKNNQKGQMPRVKQKNTKAYGDLDKLSNTQVYPNKTKLTTEKRTFTKKTLEVKSQWKYSKILYLPIYVPY